MDDDSFEIVPGPNSGSSDANLFREILIFTAIKSFF